MSEWIELADGVTRVPSAAVAALDELEKVWPGATFSGARPAIVAAVMSALENLENMSNESPYPTQAQMNAEDAQEMYRLAAYLRENRDDTRLACEPIVDWATRLLDDH